MCSHRGVGPGCCPLAMSAASLPAGLLHAGRLWVRGPGPRPPRPRHAQPHQVRPGHGPEAEGGGGEHPRVTPRPRLAEILLPPARLCHGGQWQWSRGREISEISRVTQRDLPWPHPALPVPETGGRQRWGQGILQRTAQLDSKGLGTCQHLWAASSRRPVRPQLPVPGVH